MLLQTVSQGSDACKNRSDAAVRAAAVRKRLPTVGRQLLTQRSSAWIAAGRSFAPRPSIGDARSDEPDVPSRRYLDRADKEGTSMENLNSLIWFLLIGGLAGFLAGKFMRGQGFGVVGDVLIGILGGVVGGFLFGLVGLASYGLIGSLLTATVGAIVLIWLVRQVRSA
jgi:uncharacterized membrane protein YeaQ/YmgE (transglycosylase-associated protein family)